MKREQLEEAIADLEDSIACAEHDEEIDGETDFDLDTARCELHDLQEQLKEMLDASSRN